MADQDSPGSQTTKRSRSGRGRSKTAAPPSPLQGYVAMHEVNAALCLAGGILAPRFEESAARDQHVVAGALQIELAAPSADALVAAQGDLSYGGVVVFEIPQSIVSMASTPSLPLWRVTRLVFESCEARELFRGRMSGYGDVPHDLLTMEVDANLFAARGSASHAMLLAASEAPESEFNEKVEARLTDQANAKVCRAIDRCAGGLLAAVSTLHGAPKAWHLVEAMGEIEPRHPGESPVEQFASAIALVADPSRDSATYAPIIAAVASVLSSGSMDDGFSAKTLLREARLQSGKTLQDGSPMAAAIQKFWDFTKDVLELRREVPDGAWADEGGSAIARGTLLFLLNPEPEQLRAVRDRIPNVGTAVHFIAGLLVGIRSGLTRMGGEVKTAGGSFLAGAAFAHNWLRDQAPLLALQRTWGPKDGSRCCSLLYDGTAIVQAHQPADASHAVLADALRAAGIQLRFSAESGDLTGKLSELGPEAIFGRGESTLPTFPRLPVVEVWVRVLAKLTHRAAVAIVTQLNDGTSEHCVSAQIVDGSAGRTTLRLSVFLLEASWDSMKNAAAVLVSKASALALCPPSKNGRRSTGGRSGSSPKTKTEAAT